MKYKKSKETQAHIISMAIDMIYAEGLEKISLNKILKAAETSKGSFYHQFNSLDELINQVFKTITTYFFEEFSLSSTKMSKKSLKLIGKKIIYGNENQDKISAVLFILISRSFSNNDLKKELIEFRKRSLSERNETIEETYVMLYDILVIGFLAQCQVVDNPVLLLDLWEELVDQLLL